MPENKRLLTADLEHVFQHTHLLWEELRGQNVFITGGTGFFGSWLLESFAYANDQLQLGAKAVVLSRHPDAFLEKLPHLAGYPAIELLEGDVRTFDFPKGEFPYVIHAATDASAKLNQDNPLLMFDTIVDGTRRTLEFARTHGTHKFLLTSSGAVYGKQPSDMLHIPEDYMGGPDMMDSGSAYGEGKRAAELLCRLYADQYRLDVKIARCFAFVGPRLPLDVHFAIGNFIRDALQGGIIRVNGDGTPFRSYLYAADLTIWLWTILFKGKLCQPYNVGSEQELCIAEIAHLVLEAINPHGKVIIAQAPKPGNPASRYVPSVEFASSDLGLQQLIDLERAIKFTVASLRDENDLSVPGA